MRAICALSISFWFCVREKNRNEIDSAQIARLVDTRL